MSPGRRVAALVLAAALAACRSPQGDAPPHAVPVQLQDYPDVPVPAAMVRDAELSRRLEVPALGGVVNVYRGEGISPRALAGHFLARMPPLGWRLVARFEGQDAILVFLKEGTLAFLGIGLDGERPTLTVLVGALGGAAAPAPAPRK